MDKKKLLKTVLTTLIIIGISIISFAGIYVNDKNTVKNIIPSYKLGRDFKGYREVKIQAETTAELEGKSEEELKQINDEKIKNYEKSKEILEKRLNEFGIQDYIVRQDLNTGKIAIELPENEKTDKAVSFIVYQGKFEITDKSTSEVLMTNKDLKEAIAGYGTDNSGYTTIYFAFVFNEEGTEKLKNITNTYVHKETTTEENTESTESEEDKEITVKVDGQELITTHFDSEISNGMLQLSLGSSSSLTTEEMQTNYDEARHMAILLNHGNLPVEYTTIQNRFIESDITDNDVAIIIYVILALVVIGLIYILFKYKKQGFKGIITIIGYISVLLLALRFFNVEIGIVSIVAIVLSILIQFIIVDNILKDSKKEKSMKKTLFNMMKKYGIAFVPGLIIATVFTILGFGFGEVLFWGIFVNIIYNLVLGKFIMVD